MNVRFFKPEEIKQKIAILISKIQ